MADDHPHVLRPASQVGVRAQRNSSKMDMSSEGAPIIPIAQPLSPLSDSISPDKTFSRSSPRFYSNIVSPPESAATDKYLSRYETSEDMSRLPSSNNQSQATNFSTRFPSGQNMEANAPSSTSYSYQEQPNSRSRSSTIGQNYPITLEATSHNMPRSPPPGQSQFSDIPQPLYPQHSGPRNSTSATSSRPVSRGHPGSAPPNSVPYSMMPGPSGTSNTSTRPTSSATNAARSPFSPPITAPPRPHPLQILLINPNSTRSMTDAMLASVRPAMPNNIELTGYTAPYPGPTAIESTTDAILSTEACLRDLAKYSASNGETVQNYDGMIVACYSKHPLIDALRESYDVPVIGIMEASLYVARMLGGRFGIITTSHRSKLMQEDQITAYGLHHFYVGSESTLLSELELESRPREEVSKRVSHCSHALAMKGADTILLGCASMVELIRAAKDGVRDEDGRRTINVIDGVEAAVHMMTALAGMSVPTSKKGMFKSEREGRRARGQNWL